MVCIKSFLKELDLILKYIFVKFVLKQGVATVIPILGLRWFGLYEVQKL